MHRPKNEHYYEILKIMSEEHGTVGSGALSQRLRGAGYVMSEATVGRVLRELDEQGFTRRDGFRGRALTVEGRRHLETLEAYHARLHRGNHFVELLSAAGPRELLDVLVARRALERETARLAATRIEERDLDALSQLVKRHQVLTEKGSVGSDEDVQFHKIIARASGNKVLQAAMDLIRHEDQFSPVLHYIRGQVRSTVVEDHRRILRELRTRDADGAERAMVHHLENLIRDVNTYWSLMAKEGNE